MDGRQWWDGYRDRLADLGARAKASARALDGIEGNATSRNGAVTITVDAAGAPRRLVFADPADGLTRAELANAVLDAARRAREHAAAQAMAAVSTLIEPGSPALRMLQEQLARSAEGQR